MQIACEKLAETPQNRESADLASYNIASSAPYTTTYYYLLRSWPLNTTQVYDINNKYQNLCYSNRPENAKMSACFWSKWWFIDAHTQQNFSSAQFI